MIVLSHAPMARIWSNTRPISRSIRSIIAAWIAIFVAWNCFCLSVKCPRNRMLNLAGAERLQNLWREIARREGCLQRGQFARDDAHPPQILPTFLTHLIPAVQVAVLVPGYVLRQSMQGKVRRGERQVFEERLAGIFFSVLLQTAYRMVRKRRSLRRNPAAWIIAYHPR